MIHSILPYYRNRYDLLAAALSTWSTTRAAASSSSSRMLRLANCIERGAPWTSALLSIHVISPSFKI
jgi:hypothetical protein